MAFFVNPCRSKNVRSIVTEDDSQDGPDHVDAQRTLGYVVGPHVKQKALVSTHYTTVSMVRTMGVILGIEPLGLYDGLAEPMTDVFDANQKEWTYTALVSEVLRTTALPLPAQMARKDLALSERQLAQANPSHDAVYWVEKTKGLDFTDRDNLDSDRFNRILWAGIMGANAEDFLRCRSKRLRGNFSGSSRRRKKSVGRNRGG